MDQFQEHKEVVVTNNYVIYYEEDEVTEEVIEEITEEVTELDMKFPKTHIDLGTIKESNITFKIPFEGDKNLIEYVKKPCSCIANINIKDDHLEVGFYPDKGSFKKTITVFLKDNKDLELKNNLGVQVYNPNKKSIKVSFSGIYE